MSESKISLANPLPAITGSKTGLRILFQNLISNAIKFNKKDTLTQIKIFSKKIQKNGCFLNKTMILG